MAGATNGDK